ncbi:hypothetical protein [Numidum massiliense]|uniref:hypothetical protein n=1 Tax=Numidum massiliense TaxID=1522315 RepID=UPI0006D55626|nr:hypothetical protein [Numidum massiliense]
MTKGATQVITGENIEASVENARNTLRKALSEINGINSELISKLKNNEYWFKGAFSDAFNDRVDKEKEKVRQLDAHNKEEITKVGNQYEQLLSSISFVDYEYETELVSTGS